MSQLGGQIRPVLRWAPYSWAGFPVVALIALSRYGWPSEFAGWLPFFALALAMVAVERGCRLLFALAAGERSHSPRDLGYQLTLALGFAVVLWSFREFMNQSLR